MLKTPEDIYKRTTRRIGMLCAYICSLVSHCRQATAQPKRYMKFSLFLNDHCIFHPPTVHPFVLSAFYLIVKTTSEIWSKQQKPFVMRKSFCGATLEFKGPCQILWQPYSVAKLNKDKLSELYHSLCCGRHEVTIVIAAWYLRDWRLTHTKRLLYICAGACRGRSYSLYDRWH
jgi:hypothetical protein